MKRTKVGRRERLAQVEAALGYRFRRPELLDQALVHKSYAYEVLGSRDPGSHNERLEFLGDAVVGFVVADLIFRSFPSDDEGVITRARAYLVNTATMVEIAQSLQLGDALRLGRGITRKGEPPPVSLLENALEAVIAAVYLDGGWEAAYAVSERLWIERVQSLTSSSGSLIAERDPKTALQEHLQSLGEPVPTYRLVRTYGPDHAKHFVSEVLHRDHVLATGEGRSKKEAEQEAARKALTTLGVEAQRRE